MPERGSTVTMQRDCEAPARPGEVGQGKVEEERGKKEETGQDEEERDK